MKKTSKKLLSFLLAFGMILSMFAVTTALLLDFSLETLDDKEARDSVAGFG